MEKLLRAWWIAWLAKTLPWDPWCKMQNFWFSLLPYCLSNIGVRPLVFICLKSYLDPFIKHQFYLIFLQKVKTISLNILFAVFQAKFYLWGVFRRKQASHVTNTFVPEVEKTLTNALNWDRRPSSTSLLSNSDSHGSDSLYSFCASVFWFRSLESV